MTRLPLRATLTGAAILGAAVLAAPAAATPTVAPYCLEPGAGPGSVAVHLGSFVPGRTIGASDLTVLVDSTKVRTGPITFVGPTHDLTIPGVVPNDGVQHTVSASVTVGRETWRSPAQIITCPAPEPQKPPAPKPPEVTPPITVVPPNKPRPPMTCPQLKRAGAGRASLRARGCLTIVLPPPRPFACPPRLVSPAWQRILLKRHGFKCPAKMPPRRYSPPVAG